jgi:DNA-binding NtrC family response regulator
LVPRERGVHGTIDNLAPKLDSVMESSNLNTVLREVERSTIEKALSLSRNRSEAIRVLNISRRTFYKKLKQYGLQ